MVQTVAETGFMSLSDFLDTLPRKPCEQIPNNRYFCTVCERLNKGVAVRCKYSSVEDTTMSGQPIKEGGPVQFIQIPDKGAAQNQIEPGSGIFGPGQTSSQNLTPGQSAIEGERVEFKVVAPLKADDDYPMLELVQPKEKQVNPIEMELLENVAIEFEVSQSSDDEPVEVEALEVEPIEDDESGPAGLGSGTLEVSGEAIEVEALEVNVIVEDEVLSDAIIEKPLPQFKPIGESKLPPITSERQDGEPKIHKKPIKKPIKRIMKKEMLTSQKPLTSSPTPPKQLPTTPSTPTLTSTHASVHKPPTAQGTGLRKQPASTPIGPGQRDLPIKQPQHTMQTTPKKESATLGQTKPTFSPIPSQTTPLTFSPLTKKPPKKLKKVKKVK